MLLVFQFPIVDVRSFFKESKELKIPLGFHFDSSSDEFIRGFGKEGDLVNRFNDSERELRKLWQDNGTFIYYTAKRALSFAYKEKEGDEKEFQIHKDLLRSKGVYGLRVAFRHFCFLREVTNSNAIGRFDVGFFVRFSSDTIDIQQIRQACVALAKLQTRQYVVKLPPNSTQATRSDRYRTLLQSPKNIARYFCASTTCIPEKPSVPVQGDLEKNHFLLFEKYVKAGTPLFFATFAKDECFLPPQCDEFADEKARKGTWLYDEIPVRGDGGSKVKLYILKEYGKTNFDLQREIHYSLARIHIEYQGIKLITGLMKKHNAAGMPYHHGIKDFQRLKDSIGGKITKTLKKINDNCDAFDVRYILDSNDVSSYKFLLETLEYLDEKISEEREFKEKKKVIKMKVTNNVNGPTTIQIVENGKIINVASINRKKLQEELENLSRKIAEITNNPDCAEDAKEEIEKNFKCFKNEANSGRPNIDEMKSFGQKIESAANFAKNTASEVAKFITDVLVILGAVGL